MAVHSLKDVPTFLPEKIVFSAYLKRGSFSDLLLIYKGSRNFLLNSKIEAVIATESLIKRIFWKNRSPHHPIVYYLMRKYKYSIKKII
ncbi:hypothetical protein [Blattabacterium sp. (Blatta orientalis)]|uniref:hypothetical protein n=1 Tax=Blattabacterium sp. (Blatta orientalis) TaxID=367806 RepID=UPI00034C88CD|nr:hypothetical protein [Blattabacterium sp. (Blatta orientalis)]